MILTNDYGVKLTLSEYDALSPKRIQGIFDVAKRRADEKQKALDKERVAQEKMAILNKIKLPR